MREAGTSGQRNGPCGRLVHPDRVERVIRTEESLDRNRPAGRNWETAEERRENGAGKSGY